MRDGLRLPRRTLTRLANGLVEHGMPPSWLGYRRVRKIPFARYVQEAGHLSDGLEVIHPESVAINPLPANIADRDQLPADAGWWGYSFRDVPSRKSGATLRATLRDVLVVPCANAEKEFWVSILSPGGASIELREISFRPWQATAIRRKRRRRIARATWGLERVFHNHSHWLTAHLPKLLLLQEQGALRELLLPETLPTGVEACLQFYGIDVSSLPRFGPDELLQVDQLTLLSTDRFRPELLRKVRTHCPIPAARNPTRRIYISRARAQRRRLLNEAEIWPQFEAAGFESVCMEALSFEEQVRLMRETAVLAAPHGAGLTNMIFCPPETDVVELADLSFPNPNFYALASAMELRYWLVSADGIGDGHPLTRDMQVDPAAVERVLTQLKS